MQQKIIQRLAARLALIGILFISAPALAQSSGTLSTGQCNLNSAQCAANGGTVTISSPSGAVTSSYNAALSQGAALVPVNVWNSCYYVDNSSANSVFVPFNSSAEWTAFVNNKPNSISLTTCGLPYSVSGASQTASVAPPYAGCTPVVINNPNVYGRTGSVWPTTPLSQNFTCGGTSVASALQWTAGNSNTTSTGQLSWNQSFKFGPDLKLKAQDTTTGGAAATSITITSGDIVKLTWSSTSAYGNIVSETPGGWSGAHGATIQPIAATQTTFTYTLTSTDSNGLSSTATVTVTVIPANCPANAAQSWVVNGTTCSGPIAATNNASSNSVTATNGPTGTASFICNNGTYAENGGATCTPVPLNCGMQSVSWSVGSDTCSGTVAATTSGSSSSVSGSGVNGATGSASFACTNGIYSQNSGATCVAPGYSSTSCLGYDPACPMGDYSTGEWPAFPSFGSGWSIEQGYMPSNAYADVGGDMAVICAQAANGKPTIQQCTTRNGSVDSDKPTCTTGTLVKKYGCVPPDITLIANSPDATLETPPLATANAANPNPTVSLSQGAGMVLTWSSTADVTYNSCSLLGVHNGNTVTDKPGLPWGSFGTGSGITVTPPSGTTVYTLTCEAPGGSASQSITAGQTFTYTYTAGFGACPSACGNSASTLSPSSCTRSDGASVDVSYCSGQTESCGATSACPVYSCNPSSVANGSVGAYPGCGITCNSGYVQSGNSCIAGACSLAMSSLSGNGFIMNSKNVPTIYGTNLPDTTINSTIYSCLCPSEVSGNFVGNGVCAPGFSGGYISDEPTVQSGGGDFVIYQCTNTSNSSIVYTCTGHF